MYDATAVGYKEFLVNVTTQTGDTGVFIFLLYHLRDSNNAVWMLPGTARIMKCLLAHLVAKLQPQSVLSDILTKSLHSEAPTGCNTIFFSGKDKNTCWKMLIKYPHLLTVVRRGDNVDVAEKIYVCIMELKKRVSRVSIMPGIVFFMKAKRGLEMLPPTHYVLELHVKRPHYEAKI